MLSILEQVIDNIGLWHKDDHESDGDHVLPAICPGPCILFRDTDIELADGETASASTKSAIETNKTVFQTTDSSSTYGRKIDLLMKHSNVSPTVIIKQQCKNKRINTAILSALNEQYGHGFQKLMAMDWIGHMGYLYMLEKHDNVFVSSLAHTMVIPKEVVHLVHTKSTLNYLFIFKNFMIGLCKKLNIKMLDHDINKRLLGTTHCRPMDDTASPALVFFTPSTPRFKKRELLT